MVNGILTIPLPGRIPADSDHSIAGACRLAHFVAGPENRLAATAVRPLLERGGADWNPLVLYGPHGSGKSHLARGVAAWWRERFPSEQVACCAASEFAQDFAAASADGSLARWRRTLRDAGLLVLEDIGQLTEKRPAQHELIEILDELAERNARVVITARVLPSHWSVLVPALRSRLSAGLAVPLAWPGPAARRAILDQAAVGLRLAKPVVHSLADQFNGSVPALLAALAELELRAKVDGGRLDANRVRRLVSQRDDTLKPSLHEIASRTASYFGLKIGDLKSPRRSQPLVAARCVAMYLARQLTDLSFQQIGKYFGGRDHTTVMHGCDRTDKLRRRDRATRQAIAELKRWLSGA